MNNSNGYTIDIKEFQPLIASIAKQFLGHGLELDDLVSEGNIGLLRAAEKFDESRGLKFSSYAVWWIRQAIQQAVAEQGNTISVPATQAQQAHRISRIGAGFEQENGRKANINELAEKSGFPERKVMDVMKSSTRQMSVDAPLTAGGKNTLLDVMPGGEFDTDNVIINDSVRDALRSAISVLNERERNVISAFYGIDREEMTLAQIGAHYGMTRERARQVRNKALRHMRKASRSAI